MSEPAEGPQASPAAPARRVLGWAAGVVLLGLAALALTQLFQNAELYPLNKRSWGNDFRFFFRAAHLLALGESPYLERYFTSPPPAAWIFVPLTPLKYPAAFTIFFALTILCCVGSLIALARRFIPREADLRTLTLWTLGIVLLFGFPFQFLIERGNIDGLLLLLVAAAVLTLDRREWLAGVLIGIAGALKLYPLLLLPALAVDRRWRALAAGSATLVALVALTWPDWPGFLMRFFTRDTLLRVDENVSLASTFFYLGTIFGGSDRAASAMAITFGRFAFLGLLATQLALDAWRGKAADTRDAAAHLLLYAPLMVSFPNLVHNYELIFAVATLPPFVWLLGRMPQKHASLAALLFGLGLGLTQFQSVAFEKLTDTRAVHAAPGLGLVLMLIAGVVVKATARSTAAVAEIPNATTPETNADAEPVVAKAPRCPSLRKPLPLTLLLTLVGALALQIWRPYFHLTDDNLSATLPVTHEIVDRLASGQPAGVVGSIFGGDYRWLSDAGAITGLCGPTPMLCSWLLLTPAKFLYIDAVSTLNLLIIAGAFAWSALWLRRRFDLQVSDGWIVFLSLSYTFTPYNFAVGACWLGFLNAQAGAPLILVALLHPDWRRGVALTAAAMAFAMFGGHIHTTIFLALLMGALALLVARSEKSWRPLGIFAGGMLAMIVLASPLLVPGFLGFIQSQRSEALPPGHASFFHIPAIPLAFSFVAGPLSLLGPQPRPIHYLDRSYTALLAFALGNVLLIAALVRKRRWSGLEAALAACALLAALFIVRPDWLQQIFSHVPLLSSLRWPFREIPLLLFFAHALLLLNLPLLNARTARLLAIVGGLFWASTFLNPPPSFNSMALDRSLLLDGVPQKFWTDYAKQRGSKPTLIVSGDQRVVLTGLQRVPFSLLGAYNHAALIGQFINASGYSPTIPPTKFSSDIRPWHHSGMFTFSDAKTICAQHPELVHVALLQTRPPVFAIRDGGKSRAFELEITSLKVREIHAPQPPTDSPIQSK